MATLSGFDASQVEPTDEFEAIPAGKYPAVITDSEFKETKAGTGTYLQFAFEIIDGDYKTEVAETDRHDEIGAMARSADIFRKAAIEKQDLEEASLSQRLQNETERESRTAAMEADTRALRLAVDALGEGLTRLSQGDLCATIVGPFPQDLERLRIDFNEVAANLKRVMTEIATNSNSIHANSQQMKSAADDLARRTEQQAASLEETSAALSEITETVRGYHAQTDELAESEAGECEACERPLSEGMEARQCEHALHLKVV